MKNIHRAKQLLLRPGVITFLGALTFLLSKQTYIFFILGCLLAVSFSISKKIGNYFDRLVITIFGFFAFNMTLGIVGWLLKIRLTLDLLSPIYAIVTSLILLYELVSNPKPYRLIKKSFVFTDYLPLVAAIVTFLFMVVPVAQKFHTNYLYQFVTFGSDNLSHIELTNIVNNNQGYRYEPVATLSKELTKGLVGYPQGIHLNISLLREASSLSLSSIDTFRGQIFFYIFVTSGFFAMFAYIFVRFSQLIVSKTKLGSLFVATVFLILFGGPLLTFYLQGFHTHLLALGFMFAQMYLLCVFGRNKSLTSERYTAYAIVMLFNVGISFTWFFILPVSLLASAIAILPDVWLDIKQKQQTITKFISWSLAYLLLGVIALAQLYVQLSFAPKSDPINEPGNINPTRQQYVILLGLACIGLYLYTKSKQDRLHARILLVFASASALFTFAIFAYQAHSVGHLSYYYYKAAYGVVIFGAVALAGIAYGLARKGNITKKFIQKFTVVFVCLLLISSGIASQFFGIKNGEVLGLQPPIANALGDILNNTDGNENYSVFVGSCNRNEDYLANRLLASLSQNSPVRQDVSGIHILPDATDDEVLSQVTLYKLYLGTNLVVYDSFTDRNEDGIASIIGMGTRVVPSDAPNHDRNTDCPNSIK